MLDIFNLLGPIIGIVLVVAGILIIIFSGLIKWIGLIAAVIGAVMIFANPILGIIAVVVGGALFFFSKIAVWIIRLLAVLLIIAGILLFTGII